MRGPVLSIVGAAMALTVHAAYGADSEPYIEEIVVTATFRAKPT